MRATHARQTMTMALVLATVSGMALGTPQAAEESQRAQRMQFSFPITFTFGTSYDGEDRTSVDVSDDVGFGFGFGYHLDEKILLGVDFTWLAASYDAFIATDFDGDQISDDSVEVAGTLDATALQFVGQYNFSTRRLTPFVRGSFGWTWIDSNIPAGPATGTCWWDPWFGYICDTWQPTFDDTTFSYGLGAGIRAELAERAFLEGSYNILWVDLDKAGNTDFDGVRLNVGWLF